MSRELTSKDITVSHGRIKVGDQRGVVLFYMHGCGHCHAFMPEYEKFATNNKSVMVTKIEASNIPRSVQALNLYEGYPTVFITDEQGYVAYKYDGDRKARAMKKYICDDLSYCTNQEL